MVWGRDSSEEILKQRGALIALLEHDEHTDKDD